MKEINLIPADVLLQLRWNNRRIIMTTLLWLFLLITVSWAVMSFYTSHYRGIIQSDRRTLAKLKKERTKDEELLSELAGISEGSEKLVMAASAVTGFSSGRVSWSDIIGELTAGGFDRLWFNRFRVAETGRNHHRGIEIEGITLESESIAELIRYLEGFPGFVNARLKKSRAEHISGRPVYRFTVSCEVTGE